MEGRRLTYVRSVNKTKAPQFEDGHIRAVFLNVYICRSLTSRLLVDISGIPGLSYFIGQRDAKNDLCAPSPFNVNRDSIIEAAITPFVEWRQRARLAISVQVECNKVVNFVFPVEERDKKLDPLLWVVQLREDVILLLSRLCKRYLSAQKSQTHFRVGDAGNMWEL